MEAVFRPAGLSRKREYFGRIAPGS